MIKMTPKEKFLFIFLQIITLGLIWIYWKSKGKKYQDENSLSQEIKVDINVIKLIKLCGGTQNIKSITNTHTKIKIEYEIRERINVSEIEKMSGISGVFINDTAITIIVGNSAFSTKELMIKYLNN